jgi:arginine exporter protein ArgO
MCAVCLGSLTAFLLRKHKGVFVIGHAWASDDIFKCLAMVGRLMMTDNSDLGFVRLVGLVAFILVIYPVGG